MGSLVIVQDNQTSRCPTLLTGRRKSHNGIAIQVGTAGFTNPGAPLDVLEGIEQFIKKEGIKDINELIGVARS